MESYIKVRKSLTSKRRRISSPPRSTPHVSDNDNSIAGQLESINRSVDQKIQAMSASLLSQFSSMLDSFQSRANTTSFLDFSAVPGYSAYPSEPPSRRPTDRTKSPAGLRFRKGDKDLVSHEDDLASARLIDETPRHPPGDAEEPQASQRASAFVRQRQAGAGFDSQADDDDADDRESITETTPADRAFYRLVHYWFRQNTYLRNKKHMLTCQRWDWLLQSC